MTPAAPFRRRTLATLVAAACGSLPLAAIGAAKAGKVDFAVGDVVATDGSGSARDLDKGSAIRVGDTIETGTGRAWLRFKDGGYMSLQPQTTFRVDDYHFEDEEDGNEKSFFSLLKGGIRAVTGIVGKRNRNAYRVTTPVATIGIRGTEYLAQLGDSLTVSCGEGICVLTNESGEVELVAGQTIYFKDQQSPGQRLTRKVVLPPNAPVTFVAGEFRNDEGELTVLPEVVVEEAGPIEELPDFDFTADQPLQAGSNSGLFLGLSYAGADMGYGGGLEHDAIVETGASPGFVNATLGSAVEKFKVEDATWDMGGFIDFLSGKNITADLDTDGVIAWGRWKGDSVDGSPFNNGTLFLNPVGDPAEGNVHFLAGAPTPYSDLMQLAAHQTVATYNLAGTTTPTFGDDGAQGGIDFGAIQSVSGALVADFGNGTVQSSLALDFANNDVTINTPAMPMSAATGGRFGASGSFTTSTLDPMANYNTRVEGFFVGGGASRAGYAYDVFINSPGPDYPINGVAVFNRSGSL